MTGSFGNTVREVAVGFLTILASATLYAGTLVPGKPTVESNRYEVPIYLNGTDNEVAALDFSLAYDPAVFQPVSIEPGGAAAAAGKLVTANLPEPGTYIVVMMGFNQTPVSNGEVARVVLERVGGSAAGETRLAIQDPTLSTAEGGELPAEGGESAIEMIPTGEGETTGGTETTQPDSPGKDTPAPKGDAEAPAGSPRAKGASAPPVMAASSASGSPRLEKTAVAAAKPAGQGGVGSADQGLSEAAARAAEARSLIGTPAVPSESAAKQDASTVDMGRSGQRPPATETSNFASGSLTIEASEPVKETTAGSSLSAGAERASGNSGGWMWPIGLAVLVLIGGGCIWALRSRIIS